MHKLECVAMCAYGENWCPSETVRLVARIIMKQVKVNRKSFCYIRNKLISTANLDRCEIILQNI